MLAPPASRAVMRRGLAPGRHHPLEQRRHRRLRELGRVVGPAGSAPATGSRMCASPPILASGSWSMIATQLPSPRVTRTSSAAATGHVRHPHDDLAVRSRRPPVDALAGIHERRAGRAPGRAGSRPCRGPGCRPGTSASSNADEQPLLRRPVEVDHDVAADDEVEAPHRERVARQVERRHRDPRAEPRVDDAAARPRAASSAPPAAAASPRTRRCDTAPPRARSMHSRSMSVASTLKPVEPLRVARRARAASAQSIASVYASSPEEQPALHARTGAALRQQAREHGRLHQLPTSPGSGRTG